MNLRQITPEIAIGGQPSEADIQQAQDNGFRTIVNLRPIGEPGANEEEERLVEHTGMNYAAIPISPETIDDALVERFLQTVKSDGAAPVLIHCKSGGRASMMVLLHLAIDHGWSLADTLQYGKDHGDLAPSETSPYRDFFETFIRRHSAGERV